MSKKDPMKKLKSYRTKWAAEAAKKGKPKKSSRKPRTHEEWVGIRG